MEEPPRIEKVTSSRGISLSDTATILQSFIDTLDNDHGTSSQDDSLKIPAVTAVSENSADKMNTPRKTRQEAEEESILRQFDLLSKQINSGLVSDDTYERMKLIRDSIVAEANGQPLLPSQVKKSDDVTAAIENDLVDDNFGDNIKQEDEELDNGHQQLINELNETVQDLNKREEKEKRREAKKAKKEKKEAKKAKKEAKREKREKRKAENGEGVAMKKIKVEVS